MTEIEKKGYEYFVKHAEKMSILEMIGKLLEAIEEKNCHNDNLESL